MRNIIGTATEVNGPPPPRINFKYVEKGTLRGFFDARLSSGLIIYGLTLHQYGAKLWLGMPGKPYIKEDGSQAYIRVVDFHDRPARDRFTATFLPLAREALAWARSEVA